MGRLRHPNVVQFMGVVAVPPTLVTGARWRCGWQAAACAVAAAPTLLLLPPSPDRQSTAPGAASTMCCARPAPTQQRRPSSPGSAAWPWWVELLWLEGVCNL